LEDGVDLGFEDGEFIVGSAELLLEARHHALTELGGIEPASAAASAATAASTSPTTTAAGSTAWTAGALIISAAAAVAVIDLAEDGKR
jgi:hypothetical protein